MERRYNIILFELFETNLKGMMNIFARSWKENLRDTERIFLNDFPFVQNK